MKKETVFLAALLHDIGKFMQRADAHEVATSSLLPDSIKNNIDNFCPTYKGIHLSKHLLWTAAFIEKYKAFFVKTVGADEYENFFKACVKHHLSDSDDIYQQIVQQANDYASGIERTGEHGINVVEVGKNNDKNERLASIFEGIQNNNEGFNYRLPISPLNFEKERFFPTQTGDLNGQEQFAKLWTLFEQEFSALTETSGDAISTGENMAYLLYRFACSVPSNINHLPDVSLYDHSKSSSVFAFCLCEYLAEKNGLTAPLNILNDEAPFLLVGGSLSGIQKYIYDIVSTDAARNLKGRSFYLQILIDNAVEIILHELSLPFASVVYASGGSFYLLAPNTVKIKEKLNNVRYELTTKLFQEHQTNLSLIVDWQEVTQGDIFMRGIKLVWSKLSEKIARLKNQKHKEILLSDYDFFFSPGEIGGKQIRDYITGEELTEVESDQFRKKNFNDRIRLIDNESGMPIKKNTYKQIELGQLLRRVDYWVTSKTPIPALKKYEFRIGDFELFNYLLSNDEVKQLGIINAENLLIRSFDLSYASIGHQTARFKSKGCVHGFCFYGGNNFPEHANGKHVTFDQMASQGIGAQKLGVLRMDVDNLGAIFIAGLDDRQLTFSRYSVLSRNMDYFFQGYLNRIWQDGFKSNCSIIYSGGDDLFVVGHWASVIDFAKQINIHFKQWVCNNPNLSISGGVAVTGGKFPVSKAADLSDEAQDVAKQHHVNDVEKNAVTIFNAPLNWDQEFPIVESLKQELVALIPNKLPRNLLQKLLTYAEKARYQKREGLNHSWRWHMAYDFSRASKRSDSNQEAFYNKIKNAAFSDTWNGVHIPGKPGPVEEQRTFLDLLEVAARWAELETKNNV